MRNTLCSLLVLGLVAVASIAQAAQVDLARLRSLAQRYQNAIEVGTPGSPDHRFVYTDKQLHVHVFRVEDGELVQDWETTALGSRAAAIIVTDLYNDGSLKLLIGTVQGRVLIYDLDTYDLEWENIRTDFRRIAHMATANLDKDPQQEIVVIADELLHIMDGFERNIEWVSQTRFQATQILIDNVDDDEQLEIILNTGRIIDSRFYNIELEADLPFGDRMALMDMNNDGFLDIVGEFADFSIRIFDIYAQREIW